MTASNALRPTELEPLRAARPDVLIIDVRTPREFSHRHIPGSYNVPLPDLAEHRDELQAADDRPVVLVCESGRRAERAGSQLADAGFRDVHVLDGGVAAWEAQGLALGRTPTSGTPWSLERQVRLTAGAMVATAVAASTVWGPARYVAGAVGAGLIVAAATDTCAMGSLLARLPHNRRRTPACDLPGVVEQLTTPTEVPA